MSSEVSATLLANTIVLVSVAIAAWALPALVMRRMVPVLGAGPRVTNYRGREIPVGLGFVWPVWIVSVTFAGQALSFAGLVAAGRADLGVALELQAGRVFMTAAAILVLGAFAFGLADDVFGSAAEKGLRGHLRALGTGRLTTGGLKFLGIGTLAAISVSPSVPGEPSSSAWAGTIGVWVLQVLAIALTANLLNLLDLRPGRALKGYMLLVVPAVVIGALRWYAVAQGDASAWVDAAALMVGWLVLLLGPIAAVWRFDLGEAAMLGDGGANPAGALAGFVVAGALPAWVLGVYVAFVLAANLASERVSFSKVIESSRPLGWLDRLGRLPDEDEAQGGTREVSSAQVDDDG